jgi:hypothetical protein
MSAPREELIFTPPPTVARFMQDDSKMRVLMGPVGSGKSVGCVMEIPRRAQAVPPMKDGIRRSRWVVVRNTMPRNRTRLTMHHDPQYYRIRNHLIDFLVTRSKQLQGSAGGKPIEVAPGLDEETGAALAA